MSVISSCGSAISSVRSGTEANAGARRWRNGVGAPGGSPVGEVPPPAPPCPCRNCRVVLQRRIDALERQAHPPGEQRVVAVVEREPLGEAGCAAWRPPPAPRVATSFPTRRRRADGPRRQSGFEPRFHPPDLRVDRGQRARGLLRRRCPRSGCGPPPGRRWPARRARAARCGRGRRSASSLFQVVGDRPPQRLQLRFAAGRERRRIERRERGLPVEVEPLQPRDAVGRQRLGLHRGAAAAPPVAPAPRPPRPPPLK